MTRITQHLRHNLIAYLALFVALGGTSYAAVNLPAGSVGARQLKNHSITPVKLNSSGIAGSVRAWAIVSAGGKVLAGEGKPAVQTETGDPAGYIIQWGVRFSKRCATEATIDGQNTPTESVPLGNGGTPNGLVAGYATAGSSSTRKVPAQTVVQTENQAGQPTALTFDVAVIC